MAPIKRLTAEYSATETCRAGYLVQDVWNARNSRLPNTGGDTDEF